MWLANRMVGCTSDVSAGTIEQSDVGSAHGETSLNVATFTCRATAGCWTRATSQLRLQGPDGPALVTCLGQHSAAELAAVVPPLLLLQRRHP